MRQQETFRPGRQRGFYIRDGTRDGYDLKAGAEFPGPGYDFLSPHVRHLKVADKGVEAAADDNFQRGGAVGRFGNDFNAR